MKAHRLSNASTTIVVKLTLKPVTSKSVFICPLALYQDTLYQIWEAEKDKARWFGLRFFCQDVNVYWVPFMIQLILNVAGRMI